MSHAKRTAIWLMVLLIGGSVLALLVHRIGWFIQSEILRPLLARYIGMDRTPSLPVRSP